MAPRFRRIAEGVAADVAWRRAMDDLIAEYGEPTPANIFGRAVSMSPTCATAFSNALHGERASG